MKSVLTLIKNDHQSIRGLCDKIKATTERAEKTRETLFAELHALLEAHTYAEENSLYSRFTGEKVPENGQKARELVLEGYEEHHVADFLLGELSELPVTEEKWTAKFEVLSESLDHHLKEEEEELFTAVKKALADEDLKELGLEFERLREDHLRKGSSKPGSQAYLQVGT